MPDEWNCRESERNASRDSRVSSHGGLVPAMPAQGFPPFCRAVSSAAGPLCVGKYNRKSQRILHKDPQRGDGPQKRPRLATSRPYPLPPGGFRAESFGSPAARSLTRSDVVSCYVHGPDPLAALRDGIPGVTLSSSTSSNEAATMARIVQHVETNYPIRRQRHSPSRGSPRRGCKPAYEPWKNAPAIPALFRSGRSCN